jgi:DNA-binding XRE family transcriptional regulator
MKYNLNRLKSSHPDWYENITSSSAGDLEAYSELCFAAMSNNPRVQEAVSAAFPGCRNAVADWHMIQAACNELLPDKDVIASADKTEQTYSSLAAAGAVEEYEKLVDRKLTKLRVLRTSRHLTQQALAKASGLNIRQVQSFESGERDIGGASLRIALRLADALGVEPKDLL